MDTLEPDIERHVEEAFDIRFKCVHEERAFLVIVAQWDRWERIAP